MPPLPAAIAELLDMAEPQLVEQMLPYWTAEDIIILSSDRKTFRVGLLQRSRVLMFLGDVLPLISPADLEKFKSASQQGQAPVAVRALRPDGSEDIGLVFIPTDGGKA